MGHLNKDDLNIQFSLWPVRLAGRQSTFLRPYLEVPAVMLRMRNCIDCSTEQRKRLRGKVELQRRAARGRPPSSEKQDSAVPSSDPVNNRSSPGKCIGRMHSHSNMHSAVPECLGQRISITFWLAYGKPQPRPSRCRCPRVPHFPGREWGLRFSFKGRSGSPECVWSEN